MALGPKPILIIRKIFIAIKPKIIREVVTMPVIIVEGPKADEETKRELVKRLTEVVREVYRVHHVSVVIHENETENVGVDGELLSDVLKRRNRA